jgi:hypothetical protein
MGSEGYTYGNFQDVAIDSGDIGSCGLSAFRRKLARCPVLALMMPNGEGSRDHDSDGKEPGGGFRTPGPEP